MEQNKLYRVYTDEELEREKENRLIHDFRYIHWHTEADKVRLNHDEYNEMSQLLKKEGLSVESPYKTRRIEWCKDWAYRFDVESRVRQPAMYVSHKRENNTGYHYIIYYTELDEEKLERENGPGHRGWNTLNEFVEKRTGKGLVKIFGTLPVENNTCYISRCVKSVKQLLWYNPIVLNKPLSNIYKGDIKSAFPSAFCGMLPNATSAVERRGRLLPTEEYPFAFYIKSGHMAEYNKYDTHDFLDNVWYKKSENAQRENALSRGETFITFADVRDEDEITVLMKPAEINITRDIGKMFWVKENGKDEKTRKWYKAMLNALIGFMRSEQFCHQHYQGHLACVAYARTVAKMVSLAEELVKEGSTPIYFATDCIMWVGKDSQTFSNTAGLGSFMEEANNAKVVICGMGQYWLEKDGEVISQKHQGIKEVVYQAKNIKTMTDFIKVMGSPVITTEIFDPELNEFVVMEVLK